MSRLGWIQVGLGPLGRGFWLPEERDQTEILMAAGGIGNAIFPLLLQQAPHLRSRATLARAEAVALAVALNSAGP